MQYAMPIAHKQLVALLRKVQRSHIAQPVTQRRARLEHPLVFLTLHRLLVLRGEPGHTAASEDVGDVHPTMSRGATCRAARGRSAAFVGPAVGDNVVVGGGDEDVVGVGIGVP